MTMPGWDEVYARATPPPWDIGRPQPAFVRLAEQGLLSGQVLDPGCGTGEQTLLAAAHGADAMGIDVSGRAIRRARDKAAERGLAARFEVADALLLEDLGLTFDTIIDSGVFHVFGDEDRSRYVVSLASVLRPGGPVSQPSPIRRSHRRAASRLSCLPGRVPVRPAEGSRPDGPRRPARAGRCSPPARTSRLCPMRPASG